MHDRSTSVGSVPASEVLGVDHRARARAGRPLPTTSTSSHPSVAELARQAADASPSSTPDGGVNHSGLSSRVADLHELRPERHGDVGGEAVRQNRPRLVEPDPDAGHQLRREADEPGVVEVVGRAGLAGRRQREAELPRAAAGAGVDDVGQHRRHQERGRVADRAASTTRSAAIQHAAVAVLDAANQHRRRHDARDWRTRRTPRSSTAASPRRSRAPATARSARRRRPWSWRTATVLRNADLLQQADRGAVARRAQPGAQAHRLGGRVLVLGRPRALQRVDRIVEVIDHASPA